MKPPVIPVLPLFLFSAALFAQEAAEITTSPAPSPDCEEAITVFQDVSRVGRKDRAAANMTRRHTEMARERWRLIDVEPYTENGDLEGFFLSYARPAACPGDAEKSR